MHPEWKHRPGTDLLKLEYHCRRDYGENSHSDLPPEWIVQEFASIAANSQRQRARFPVEVNGPCHCPRDPNDPNLSHQVDRDDGWQATWKRRRCSGVPDRGSRTVAPWAIKVPTPTSHRRLAADWLAGEGPDRRPTGAVSGPPKLTGAARPRQSQRPLFD